MSKFSDYLASQITPQMTLLEKFNLMIKFLQENNYISVFYSQENYNVQTESYQKEKVNLNGFTLHIGDCIVFSNGYYAFVETIGVNNFTIGNVLYFQGEQGVSVVGATISSGNLILTLSDGENVNAGNIGAVSSFSINSSQHLIVNYANGTTQDLGAIFSGNINISGTITASGAITGGSISTSGAISGASESITGNLAVGGAITGGSIIENMEGYSFTQSDNSATHPEVTMTINYAGVVKNGNKITFVIAGSIVSSVDKTTISLYTGRFYFPSAIGNKLFPMLSSQVLDIKQTPLFLNDYTYTPLLSVIYKRSSQHIEGLLSNITLTAGTSYAFRQEVTFLLSDSL